MTVGITELPPEGMQLPGVSLAGDPERGTKTTEGISLLFTTAGVTVQGPQPQIERLLVWKALDSASCREKIQLPDGREAVIMELTSGGQSIRFLLPNDAVSPGQAAYLDQALPAWLLRYKGAVSAPSAPVAPSATASTEPEVGVALPPPGPNTAPAAAEAEATPAPAAESAPAFANAMAVAAGAVGATALTQDPANGISPGTAAGTPSTSGAPSFQAPPMAAPPAPSGPGTPAGPTMYATPPTPGAQPTPPAPGFQTLPPPPAAPTFQAPPPPPPAPSAPPAAQPGVAATAPVNGWAEPPTGPIAPTGDIAPTGPADIAAPKPTKKPRFALTRKQLHAAEAAAAAGGVADASDLPAPPAPPAPEASSAVVASTTIDPPKPAKKPRFALTRKQLHAAEAAAAAGGAATVAAASDAAAPTTPAPPTPEASLVPPPPAPSTTIDPPKPAKKPRFALTRKQLHAAEAAAAAGTVAAVADTAPQPVDLPAPPTGLSAPPVAAPVDPVPLAVQPLPPPPAAEAATAPPPPATIDAGDASSGASGTGEVTLAKAGSRSRRTSLVALVILLVVVLAGAGYFITKKNSPTSTTPAPAPAASGASDTVLAGSINLRQSDLPSGWTETPPAQAVVRPPVAPAVAQATATNALAGCLGSNFAVVSGLFASGSLPGQTSLVQSPVFQSAAGSSFEMASRTTVLSSAGEVQALNSVFTNPKFDSCYQQFRSSLASAVVPGATVAVEPVTLSAPSGVKTYGVVSTYTLPGSGTQVVGDAYILGGRVVTILQPTTSGADIASSVFGPAYNSVAGRVAASVSK